jgi:hypothetical protein
MKNLLHVLVISVLVVACKKEEEKPVADQGTGNIAFTFEHRWGPTMAPFEMNTWYTHPQTSDSLRFTNIQYYISNIKLKKSDGTWWVENESYRLIDAVRDGGMHFVLQNVPNGEYTEIQIMIGVDSIRNISGVQSGALDPAWGMFWTWQSGYIFVKSEGLAPAAPQGNFQYHLGGFSEPHNAIQTRTFNISATPLRIASEQTSRVTIRANVARFWHGGVKVSETHTIHMPNAMATQMAANFAEGFMVSSVAN